MKQGKVDEAKKHYTQALKAIKSLSNRQKSHSKTIQRKAVLLQLIKGVGTNILRTVTVTDADADADFYWSIFADRLRC